MSNRIGTTAALGGLIALAMGTGAIAQTTGGHAGKPTVDWNIGNQDPVTFNTPGIDRPYLNGVIVRDPNRGARGLDTGTRR
jgi:hypothetical protein